MLYLNVDENKFRWIFPALLGFLIKKSCVLILEKGRNKQGGYEINAHKICAILLFNLCNSMFVNNVSVFVLIHFVK